MTLGRPKASHYDAMAAQRYRVKREVCATCAHFLFRREPADWAVKLYPDDPARQQANLVFKGLRCGLGGFPVKKTATCDKWSSTCPTSATTSG